jgi:surfactin synthase thioesterase subunit
VNRESTPGTLRSARWLLHPRSADAPARLFCFPYSGCGASMYRQWPRRIGPAEVCQLQPPGRENRLYEPPYDTYQALADDLVEFLLPHLDRPFAFFGHCGGALPGFETTLRLAQRGLRTPSRLFVSSQVAPHDGPYGRFLSMSDAELEVELAELTRAMGGEPHPAMLKLSLGVLRADVEANKRYRLPEPVQVPTPITVIAWRNDSEVAAELMGGWRHYAAEVRYTLLDGVHYSFLEGPAALQAEIARDMELAVSRPPAATEPGVPAR